MTEFENNRRKQVIRAAQQKSKYTGKKSISYRNCKDTRDKPTHYL